MAEEREESRSRESEMSETENIDVKSEETGGLVGTEVVDRSGEVTIEVPTEVSAEVSTGSETAAAVGASVAVDTEGDLAEHLAKQTEIDGRSIYVGNVDYQSNPEQLEEFFHTAGVIERVTILFDRYSGLPKGYAYVEFEHAEGVQRAIDDLHGKTFRGESWE